MPDKRPLVSIVCPAYQEEEVLPLFHGELCAVLATLETDYRFEILYVDDGSRDGTLAVLQAFADQDARVGYLSLSRNFGQQAALTAGLEHARGDAVISMDSDLQHPPSVLPRLLAEWRAGKEVVITIRGDDPRLGLFKRLSSRAFYHVMSYFSDTEIRLAASDFRLLSRKALQALLRMREKHRFVRGMVQWLGFPSAEIAFAPDERRAGRTKYTLRRLLHLAGDGLFSFSRVPLHLATWLGVLFLILGAIHSGWLLWTALADSDGAPLAVHYLLVVTHLLGGSILCVLGFLGEYVGRIYEQVKQRPLYVLKEHMPAAESVAPMNGVATRQREAA